MRRGLLGFLCLIIGVYVGCGSNADNPEGKGGKGGGAGAAGGGKAGSSSGGFAAVGPSGGAAGTAGAGDGDAGTTGSGTWGSGGTGGGSGGTGGSSVTDGSASDVIFTYDAPVNPGGDACAATSVTAESLPLDVYIILDASGSMHDPQGQPIPIINPGGDCNIGQTVNSKWCRAINALHGFFAAPTSAGMGVALQFFSGNDCTPLATPNVALQTLPAHLAQLDNALNAQNPGGNTPTLGAAEGIVQYTRNNQRAGRKMIGVIVTDGEPTQCDSATNNPSHINTVLRNHFTTTTIATYFIGMDGIQDFTNLQTMANGAGAPSHTSYCGGTVNPCHFYNVGNGNPQAFIDALKAIQQTAVACEFAMPRPQQGVVDISKVQVSYLAGGQPPPQQIPRVNDAGSCTSNGGWYFDNNTTPTRILLCPETCRAVSGDVRAQIDVFLGCLGG